MYIGSSFLLEFSIAEVTEAELGIIVVKTTSLDQYVGEGRYSRVGIPISGSAPPLHQHLFDFNPLPEQELVLNLVGVIRECNFLEKSGNIPAN
jgi:hypothetical protein